MAGKALYREMDNDGASVYYNENFRNMIEFHLDYLRSRNSTIDADVPQNVGLRHEYNFYGLLTELKIQPYLHWIILRMNFMTTPMEYRVNRTRIMIPDRQEIEKLKTTFTMLHKI